MNEGKGFIRQKEYDKGGREIDELGLKIKNMLYTCMKLSRKIINCKGHREVSSFTLQLPSHYPLYLGQSFAAEEAHQRRACSGFRNSMQIVGKGGKMIKSLNSD